MILLSSLHQFVLICLSPLAGISVLLMSGVTGMAQPLNLDQGFAPMITTPASVDVALPLPDGRLVVAGPFHLLNGEPRSGLAALLPDGTVDKTFSGSLLGLLHRVAAITWQPDGKFIAGIQTIYRFNGDGSLDSTFNAGRGVTYSQPRRLLWVLATYPDGKIAAGGEFEWAQDQYPFFHGQAR